ncbi:CDP-alcohol phosphatidyltransferase family protein [Dongia sedimenti]|uniref:CDP-alcohol phosphatidyltransferase family protein n=1 Tax=Dongia sedimenti TaxID=3064282 RepID=A0ABU0YMI2_9PROT|nr:CDP-alcohol phosphatidyltransferase family protein [Rhodospirillaceae bacterium R-7]
MIVWIDALAADSAPPIFGLSLLERHLHGLRGLKPLPSRIIIDLAAGRSEPKLGDKRLYRLPLEWRRSGEAYAARLGQILASAGSEPLLVLDATTLADGRLPAALAARTASTVVLSREAQDPAAILFLAGDRAVVAGELVANPGSTAALARRLVDSGGIPSLKDDEFSGFVRRLRRTLPYYLFTVDGAGRAAKLERFLFWSNYKGSTDLFTRYVYPPLVWLAVRPLARWRVHPNWVTLVSIILALAAIPCWADGYFITGFMMAYGMSVLDSVDGKLARLTFTDSVSGNYLDHGLDMVHPPLWYLSWAYGLGIATEGWASPLGQGAIAIFALYVIDRVVLKIYPYVFKRAFHTHSRMDGLVRSFIARRNISLPLFTVGYLIGFGREAFFLIVAWQAATTLYHAGRTFWILCIEKAQHKDRAPVEVAAKTVKLD